MASSVTNGVFASLSAEMARGAVVVQLVQSTLPACHIRRTLMPAMPPRKYDYFGRF